MMSISENFIPGNLILHQMYSSVGMIIIHLEANVLLFDEINAGNYKLCSCYEYYITVLHQARHF
ncbi:MAG: hypothetical protein ACK5VB_04005, partial [Bacteroidota bacterium]